MRATSGKSLFTETLYVAQIIRYVFSHCFGEVLAVFWGDMGWPGLKSLARIQPGARIQHRSKTATRSERERATSGKASLRNRS